MKKYCKEYLTEKHIWTSIHHPQTMGNFKCSERTEKISNTQRLRRSTDHEDIDRCISVYVDWYNNGKKISSLQNVILKKDILDKEI